MMANAPKMSGASGASAPPASMTCASPRRISRNASPMANAPEAQELALVMFGPCSPSSIATLHEAAEPKTVSARIGSTPRMPAPLINAVLLLGKAQPAQRAAQVDARPARGPLSRVRPGVGHRLERRRRRRTANSGRACAPGAGPGGRAGRSRPPGRRPASGTGGVEAGDAPHRRLRPPQPGPEAVAPLPDGADHPQARHHHPPAPGPRSPCCGVCHRSPWLSLAFYT